MKNAHGTLDQFEGMVWSNPRRRSVAGRPIGLHLAFAISLLFLLEHYFLSACCALGVAYLVVGNRVKLFLYETRGAVGVHLIVV